MLANDIPLIFRMYCFYKGNLTPSGSAYYYTKSSPRNSKNKLYIEWKGLFCDDCVARTGNQPLCSAVQDIGTLTYAYQYYYSTGATLECSNELSSTYLRPADTLGWR